MPMLLPDKPEGSAEAAPGRQPNVDLGTVGSQAAGALPAHGDVRAARQDHEISTQRPAAVRVVGIGASAGGLEALRVLVRTLQPGMGACYAIAQHLSPSHRSMLVELLARESSIHVVEMNRPGNRGGPNS